MKFIISTVIFFAILWPHYAESSGDNLTQRSNGSTQQCLYGDFPQFLRAFADDVDLQKRHIKYPLNSKYVDANAWPEPKQVTQSLRKNQIHFPVIPSEFERRKQSLGMRVIRLQGDDYEVSVYKEDAGYKVSYFFSKNICWTLVRINDESI